MAWLEAHQELRDHPKTKRAARILGISRPQMIGHMLCLWWWCLDYAQDGDLSDFDNADIADAAEWDGEPEAFVKALLTCGPADRAGFLVDHNGLRVNDWEEYGGRYIVKRNQSRDRQRTYRQRNTDEKPHNALVTRDSGVSSNAREDKIREDKTEMRDRPPASAPSSPQMPADPEWGAALSKLEALGMMTGSALLEFQALWPDLNNGKRAWLDDAIRVAQANNANSPVYAIRVLAKSVSTGRRPGETQKAQGARPQGHNLRELLGLDKDD